MHHIHIHITHSHSTCSHIDILTITQHVHSTLHITLLCSQSIRVMGDIGVYFSRIPWLGLVCLGSSLGHAFPASAMIISHTSAAGCPRSPYPSIYKRLQPQESNKSVSCVGFLYVCHTLCACMSCREFDAAVCLCMSFCSALICNRAVPQCGWADLMLNMCVGWRGKLASSIACLAPVFPCHIVLMKNMCTIRRVLIAQMSESYN